MSLSGNEGFNFRIGMEFIPGDALSRYINTLEQMRQAGQRFSSQPLTLFDQANNTAALQSARKLARDMHAVMEGELKRDLLGTVGQQRIPKGQPGAGQYSGPGPLTPDTKRLFEASLGPVERAAKTYAEQLSYAAAQLRVRALRTSGDDAKTLAASARELETHAALARKTTTLANARERETRAVLDAAVAEERRGRDVQVALGREINAMLRRAEAEKAAGQKEQEATGRVILALDKRKAAEDKAAAAAAETVQARSYAFQPRYPNANATTGIGQAEIGVNRALRNLQIATEAEAALLKQTDVSLSARRNALKRVTEAEEALAAAENKQSLASIKAGQTGGFGSQFALGFKGETERPYAEQIGQAFKFSIFYGTAYKLLSALTQTFQQTLQEGIEFEQAMSELQLASGQSADSMRELSDNLGRTAAAAGQAPSQGVLVGARSLGLYGAAGGSGVSKADQAYIAEVSTRVATRLAVGSGKQPAEILTSLAAISNAFGTGASGQSRTADLDAYLTKKFGVQQGATLVPVAEAGTVGSAAGFDQAQVTAIAAALEARTGQTESAVAGFMAQIFTRGGEGSLTSVSQKYGVDTSQPLSKQISQLAEVYKTATGEEKNTIAAAFGRGKVQNAAVALLQSFPEIAREARKADAGGATGSADAQFNLRMDNIGGQIALLQGSLKEFAQTLGQSGLLDAIGLAIVVFRHLVDVGTDLLRVWESLPGPIRDIIEALAAFVIATKLATGANILTQEGRAAAVGATFIGGPGGKAGSFLTANAKSMGLAALVLGDAYLWGSFRDSTQKLTEAQQTTTSALKNAVGPGASPDEIRAQASALSDAAAQARASDNGIFGAIASRNPLGLNHAQDVQVQAQGAVAQAESRRLTALAKAEEASAAGRTQAQVAVTGFDSQSITDSMTAITDAGGTAADQFKALTDTLNQTTGAASRAAAAFQPNLFAGEAAGPLSQAIGQSVSHRQGTVDSGFSLKGNLFKPHLKYRNIAPEEISAALSTDDIASRMSSALTDIGQPVGELTAKQMNDIAKAVLRDTSQKAFGKLGPSEVKAAQRLMQQAIVGYLRKQKDLADAVAGGRKLSPTDLTSYLNGIVTASQAILDSLPQSDYRGRIKQAQALVREIQAAIRNTKGGATDDAVQKLQAAREAVASATIDRLEAVRKAAQHIARSDAEVKAIGRGSFNKELRAAIRAGSSDQLVRIVSQAGDWSIAIARQAIQEALKVARAAVVAQQAAAQFAQAELAGIQGMMGQHFAGRGGPTGKQKRRIDSLRQMLEGLSTTLPAGENNVYDTGSDANRPADAAADSGPTAAQVAAARASALAQGSESQIRIARAAMQSARADMAAAKRGTVEYYSALGAYLSARNELTDAIQAYHQNLYLLAHDATNPLVQARAAARAAAAKLRSDAGKPADVRAADRVALQQAQASKEATAFQQRLDAVQTAEQLGRVSHQRYIRYLENESHRLNQIKNRTYQQQQQLNQIDSLLQDASKAMEGQFNIAGIKLPTVYQVRRAIAERAGDGPGRRDIGAVGRGNQQVNSNNTTYIQIDGADYTKVKRLVTEEINKPSRIVTSATRRRVG